MFFHRAGSGGCTWLLVGLGNPGAQYASTRHNMGFLALDKLADNEGFSFNRLRFKAWTAVARLGGEQVLVMKPQTFMNLSGEAVGEAARFYKIPPERVLVISDDVSLPVGKLRIRAEGSAGGHNGLKDIIRHLGSDRFPRIKVGVGMPDVPGYDMADWVTGRPAGSEQKPLMDALDRAVAAVPVVIRDGVAQAQSQFN